ncbi:MAG TPA: hypothetical protein VI956_00950 [Nitrospirota bacterium]|nr:hypothetical protein [Nitrospirota bacterium]
MQKPLADVIAEIGRSGNTGILTIGVKNDPSLFKIFFRAGAIYHITHGTCRDMECLIKLSGLDFESGFFMSGARVEISGQTLPRNEEIIAKARTTGKMIRWDEHPAAGTDTSREAASIKPVSQETRVEDSTLMRMEEELLNIAGPVAQMVLDSAYGKCNLKKGTPMKLADFKRLIETASEGLPEEQKKTFVAKFA